MWFALSSGVYKNVLCLGARERERPFGESAFNYQEL